MTDTPTSITCPRCRRTSYNPNDVLYRYCGNCHQFLDVPGEADVQAVVQQPQHGLAWRVFVFVLDLMYGVSALMFFVAGKLGASWWWLTFLAVVTAAAVFQRRRM